MAASKFVGAAFNHRNVNMETSFSDVAAAIQFGIAEAKKIFNFPDTDKSLSEAERRAERQATEGLMKSLQASPGK